LVDEEEVVVAFWEPQVPSSQPVQVQVLALEPLQVLEQVPA
jgi:hypothetical protein